MVVQGWNIGNVSVVGHVERKAYDLSWRRSFHSVVNGWIHRNLHVVEFVNGHRQNDGVSDSRFTATCVWINLL